MASPASPGGFLVLGIWWLEQGDSHWFAHFANAGFSQGFLPCYSPITLHTGKYKPSRHMELISCRIAAYPNVSFTVVINPFNGPGLDDLPDANYQREIPKLTCHANVKVVGYIHTTWAKRDLALVLKDIEKYAQWPECSGLPDLKISGVFVDETPNTYDAEAEAYLAKLCKYVKKMPGGDENVVCVLWLEGSSVSAVLMVVQGYSQPRMRSGCCFSQTGRLDRRIRRYLPYLPGKGLQCHLLCDSLVHG